MENMHVLPMEFLVTANTTDTMSFLGLLSPAASSVDSTDVKMDVSLSPMNAAYNSALHMMEDFATGIIL